MIIEESIIISASLEKVWKTFTDLTCWDDWNTVMKNIYSSAESIEKAEALRFCIRPFMFPVYLKPFIEKVIPKKQIVWSGSKFGIFARHEFVFEESEVGVILKSVESFEGIFINNISLMFPEKRIREITKLLLIDLKRACES